MNLAVFTPLNPARCGVSDYCEALLPRLAEHAEVAAFVDEYPASGFRGDAKVRIVPAAEFRADEFDAALYHIGNNPYHLHAFDAALKHPGIVVLHEFNLHHLVAAATISRDDWPGYLREAEYNGGAEGLRHAKRVQALEAGPDYEGLAMNKRLLERGSGRHCPQRIPAAASARCGLRASCRGDPARRLASRSRPQSLPGPPGSGRDDRIDRDFRISQAL